MPIYFIDPIFEILKAGKSMKLRNKPIALLAGKRTVIPNAIIKKGYLLITQKADFFSVIFNEGANLRRNCFCNRRRY